MPLKSWGTIRGRVTKAHAGTAIESANVYDDLSDQPETTDSSGRFALEGVPEGPVVLVANHPAYRAARVQGLSLPGRGALEVAIELHPSQGIRGTVGKDGRPVFPALVSLEQVGGSLQWQTSADPDGFYEFADIPSGVYRVSLATSRCSSLERVEDARFTEHKINAGAVLLSGRVLLDGSPLSEAFLEARRSDWTGGSETHRIDSSGRYSMELPGKGQYILLLKVWDGPDLRVELTVPAGVTELARDLEFTSD